MNEQYFDVIVIGGGHSGIEASYASAKMGSKTLLLTLDENKIGLMPCNPSVGGLGKGHIVYEISALGGLMPKLCSTTYLQARMLNTSKGPAVQGLRLQIDKYAYNKAAILALKNTKNLTILSDAAMEVLLDTDASGSKKIKGIKTKGGHTFYASSIVVTTGTFLNGLVHLGLQNHPAGRMGEAPSIGLSESLQSAMGVKIGRLKTGTPPRLLRSSIDFEVAQRQPSDELEFLFEWNSVNSQEKVPCFITHTNEETHDIIRSNLDKSAMYSGNIKGVGPRYCPSIEDKIGRFASKNSHHVFIEPEGGDNSEVYPAGLSTSLPLEVQEQYIKSIKGFQNAIIVKAGYAVEYDFVQPTHLKHTLETKSVKGLFLAGQINGTTGYEEAAGQGILAGINASLNSSQKDQITLSRDESYIGIMIDDLVTLGADEPYRMFTSRAERRLLLRQDNVFMRLMPLGYKLGLIDKVTYEEFLQERALFEKSVEILNSLPKTSELYGLFSSIEFTKEIKSRAKDLLAEYLEKYVSSGKDLGLLEHKDLRKLNIEKYLNSRLLLGVHAEIKYAGYLEIEKREVEKSKRYSELEIPDDIDFFKLSGLSVELAQKLARFKPKTIAQAHLIQGMTPAAISLLIFQIRIVMKRDLKKEEYVS